MDLEKIYEKYDVLSNAKDKISEHEDDFLDIIEGVKGGEKEKKLTAQIIAKFFKHFPTLQTKALEAILDLCEDEDSMIRICAMKALPVLCKDSKEHLHRIVYSLIQLLELEDQEYVVASNSIKSIYKDHPLDTIKTIFQFIKHTNEATPREKCLSYVLKQLADLSDNLPEVDDLILEECKKLLPDSSVEEFLLIMPYLTKCKAARTVTGAQQLLDVIADQMDLDQEFDPLEQDTNNTDKVVTCLKYALPLFSVKLDSSRFVSYLCGQVLPHWEDIGKLDQGEMVQYNILMLLAELSIYCGKLENASLLVVNIFDKLKTYMISPPEEDDSENLPNLDFSSVECLLFAFHRLARQCPDFLTHDPLVLKDFRARLLYFSRGLQACRKTLLLKKAAEKSGKSTDIIVKKLDIAPSMLDNINMMVKDLFYQPPIYKCNVTLSFKTASTGRKRVESTSSSITSSSDAPKRHQPITFDSNGSSDSKQNKTDNVKLYTPPSGKFSNKFQSYERSSRGRGGSRGFRGGRGRSSRGGWRN